MDKNQVSKRKLLISGSAGEDEDEEFLFEENEDSDSEPDIDCDIWDDSIIINLRFPKSVVGYHLMPTCNRDPSENLHKKLKISPELRKNLLDSNLKQEFKVFWNNNQELDSNGINLISDPFRVCVISNFLENPDFLNDVRQEFNDIDWNLRSMDLYEFSQSKDLKHLTQHKCLTEVYKLLGNDVMKWVSELTDLDLTHISATCSSYSTTDYLLVHDDQREDRLIAFILYLNKRNDWEENKGGALELLNKDENGHPDKVIKRIFPTNNQFVFFPVTNDSYHQVAEITSLYDSRLSINGWFHTKIPPVYKTPTFKPYPDGLYAEKQHKPIDFDSDLAAWISDGYLEQDIMDEIQEYFEEHSEISLKRFLRDEPFNELSAIFFSDTLNWIKIGPPNRYNYEVVKMNDLPIVLDRFFKLFYSKQMFALLKKFTGLEFKNDKSSMKFELQRWTPGCYSLLGDYDWYEKKQLDLVLNFGCQCNSDVIGAKTLYVTTDDEIQDALITLEPEENNLNLIYRDTARFTKYFSTQSRCRCFYTLICSYNE